jgi:dTDP-4-amino-4,6-dideoxygalactose transaminase/predicted O-linked N-acetylglucosamine transferase (SPINDLY family)
MMNAQSHQDNVALMVDQSLRQAISCYQAGQLQDAEFIFRDVLTDLPRNSDANHNLGILLVQTQRFKESLPHFEAALNVDPRSAQFWSNYIDALIQAGLVDAARQALVTSQSIGLDGGVFETLSQRLSENMKGACAPSKVTSRSSSLVIHSIKPRKQLKATKKVKERKRAEPSSKEMNAVDALFKKGQVLELEIAARKLMVDYPESHFGWKVLGVALHQEGQYEEALVAMQKSIFLSPDDSESHNNLGNILQILGRLDESEISCRRALEINPNFAGAYNNLGNTLLQLGRAHEAEVCCRKSLQIEPNRAHPHNTLGNILSNHGRNDEAENSFRRALEIQPNFEAGRSNLLFHLAHKENISAQELFAEHCRFGERVEAPLRDGWAQHTNSRDPERCLQIGFVSADLRNHAVANFMELLLVHLANHTQLSLHAYSNSPIEDDVTKRLRCYFKSWSSISGLSDAVLAEKIRIDGIDILIDLSGHTSRNRLLTFARKPAPLQVSWIGYPGTTGLQAMDYYLSDRFALPFGQFDDQFTEKIVLLPAVATFSPFKYSPSVNLLPALNNGYVTFGSFNQTNKINPSVIALWSQLLREVPGSRMLLGAMPLERGNDSLVEMFAREGIQSERLSFYPRTGMESYLALHHQVDICLDTFPYNGGTTIHHALWMGVPTLTLAGNTVPARSGASILGQVELDSFVANSKEDFVRKGLFWVGNLESLAGLRNNLRERVQESPHGQPNVIAEGLERALRVIWRRWCEGLSVESFEVISKEVDDTIQTDSQDTIEQQKMLPIYVTQPTLPPLEEFIPYLKKIWDSKQLTNAGPFHQRLEQELCDHLGVKHISLFSNGTLALMTAMQALRITGEVITTPYSFVATAHSLLWNGLKPVFVDIDPITLNLDSSKIEAAITSQTTAIMPVHCYGHPCDVKGIQKIADNYGLKVIYDAAHAFGVQCPEGSILNYGDLSVLSFHATKVFNTFEGGAIVCHDRKTKQRIDHLKNFGFVDEVTVVAAGINGKMSEINAAFGLLQLKSVDEAIEIRRTIDIYYRETLARVKGIQCLSETIEKVANYAYFPILVKSDYPMGRDDLYQKLRDNGIYARRYFYPLVSDFPMYRGMPSAAHDNLPVAKKISEQVICLPIYPDLLMKQVDFIVNVISR